MHGADIVSAILDALVHAVVSQRSPAWLRLMCFSVVAHVSSALMDDVADEVRHRRTQEEAALKLPSECEEIAVLQRLDQPGTPTSSAVL